MTDEIEWTPVKVKLGDLSHWADNPVTLTKAQAGKLLRSKEKLGKMQTLAIGPSNGDGKYPLYDGHQRANVWGAAFGMGLEVWALQSSRPLTDEERHAVPIMLRTAVGSLDWDMLAGWTDYPISEWGLDEDALQGLKFDIAALGNLLESETPEPADAVEIDIDRAEELQEKWRVQFGEIFRMGEHFIICGDCRETDTWKRLLGAAGVDKVNGVFTSPPYAEQRKAQYGGVPTDKYVEWWEAVQANVKANLANDGSFFVNIKENSEDGKHSLYVFDLVCAMVRRFSWQYRDDYRWVHSGVPGDAEMMHRFKNQHEPVFWFSISDGYKFRPLDMRHKSDGAILKSPKNPGLERIQGKSGGALVGAVVGTGLAFPGNVLDIGKNNDSGKTGGHVAAFPVSLPDFFVRAYSDTGDTWLDPFVGSGTTIVAAANNKRRGLGIELLQKYCAVTLERMATAFPGIEIARLEPAVISV